MTVNRLVFSMLLKRIFKQIKSQLHLHNLDYIIQGADFVFKLEAFFSFSSIKKIDILVIII